jgi:hypothetical protein
MKLEYDEPLSNFFFKFNLRRYNLDGGGDDYKSKATRYRPAMLDVPVFMHPSSTLHKTAPDFVVYCDLMQTSKRPYLVGATAVEAAWLVEDAPALAAGAYTRPHFSST